MSTFLELVQQTALEAGIVSTTGLPTSLTGVKGRQARVVEWVQEAWLDIQTDKDNWLWMRKTFTSTVTTAGAACYTPASWNLTNLSRWITDNDCREYIPTTIYLQSTGVSDESALQWIPYGSWRSKYARGEQVNNRPTEYAISPANEFCLGAVPNDAYIVQGEYVAAPQSLSNSTDKPELPERYHPAIKWLAVLYAARYLEADTKKRDAQMQYQSWHSRLCRDQLPAVRLASGTG